MNTAVYAFIHQASLVCLLVRRARCGTLAWRSKSSGLTLISGASISMP